MKINLKKGFTLIELLVVVAIIGILASVVLASLNSARSKGSNAAVKANLANLRAQAAIFYDDTAKGNGTYTSGGGIFADTTFAAGITAADLAGGATAVKFDDAQNWVVATNLKAAEGANAAWCVDSNGKAEGITATTVITSIATLCP